MDSVVHKLEQESLASARTQEVPALTRTWSADLDTVANKADLPPELTSYAHEPMAAPPLVAPPFAAMAPDYGYSEQTAIAPPLAGGPPDYGYAEEPIAAPQLGGPARHSYPPSPSRETSLRWDLGPTVGPQLSQSTCSRGRHRFLFSDREAHDAIPATPSTPSRRRLSDPVQSPMIGGDSCYPRSRSTSNTPEGQPQRRPSLLGSFQAPPGPPAVNVGASSRDEAEARRAAEAPASPRSYRRLGAPLPPPAGGLSRSALAGMVLGRADTSTMHFHDVGGASLADAGAYPDEATFSGYRHVADYSIPSDEVAHQVGLSASSASPRPRSRAASFDERRDTSPRLSGRARDASVPRRSSSRRRLYGPERFHYDTSTYTGVHRHGGPSIMDKCGVTMYSSLDEMVRPHLRRGGTFMSSQGNPLSKKCPAAFLLPVREEDRVRWEMEKLRRSSSSSQLFGPDRFYYDKSTYTGAHRFAPGGPLEFEAGGAHQYPEQRENIVPPNCAQVSNMAHISSYLTPAQHLADEWPPWPHEPVEVCAPQLPSAPMLRPAHFDPGGAVYGVPEGSGNPFDYEDQVGYRSARVMA